MNTKGVNDGSFTSHTSFLIFSVVNLFHSNQTCGDVRPDPRTRGVNSEVLGEELHSLLTWMTCVGVSYKNSSFLYFTVTFRVRRESSRVFQFDQGETGSRVTGSGRPTLFPQFRSSVTRSPTRCGMTQFLTTGEMLKHYRGEIKDTGIGVTHTV